MRIRPPELLFDGYAPGYQRARNLNWGSVVLGDGINDLTFTVVGKNPDSAGYKVGIDWFSLSPSASRREGEIFCRPDSHPVSPFYRFILSGGTVSAQDMSAHGAGWSGNCRLTYDAGPSATPSPSRRKTISGAIRSLTPRRASLPVMSAANATPISSRSPPSPIMSWIWTGA